MPFVCHERHPTPFDIPMRWKPQRELMVRALRVTFADFFAAPWQGLEKSERCPNNSSLHSLFCRYATSSPGRGKSLAAGRGRRRCCSSPDGPQNGIQHPLTFLCAGTRALHAAFRVAFADFSAAPWRGLEKSERGPNNSSLFQPLAAVVVVAVQVLTALRTASDTV